MHTIVLSLGGSLIVPNEIDIVYLKKFKVLIEEYVEQDYRFIIVTGGGSVCRTYQKAAKEITEISNDDADWIGVNATRINAELVRSIFGKKAYKFIVKDPTKRIEDFNEQILIAGGWKPGFSSDMDAVLLAKKFDAKKVINLTNIDHVYDSDPKTNPDAKKLENISWSRFRDLVGDSWDPGLNKPFDPIASKEAEFLGLTVIIAKGNNIENLKNILSGEEFIGTIIN